MFNAFLHYNIFYLITTTFILILLFSTELDKLILSHFTFVISFIFSLYHFYTVSSLYLHSRISHLVYRREEWGGNESPSVYTVTLGQSVIISWEDRMSQPASDAWRESSTVILHIMSERVGELLSPPNGATKNRQPTRYNTDWGYNLFSRGWFGGFGSPSY